NYTKPNCWRIGSACRQDRARCRLNHWSKFMIHPIHRVKSFQIVAPYTLRVQFDDNTEQTIDFQPILAGELYRPLRDLKVFNQVQMDPEVHTLVWPNGADFDPATLHDWPDYVQALISKVGEWESAAIASN